MNIALQIIQSTFSILPHRVNFIALSKPATEIMSHSRNYFFKNSPKNQKEPSELWYLTENTANETLNMAVESWPAAGWLQTPGVPRRKPAGKD